MREPCLLFAPNRMMRPVPTPGNEGKNLAGRKKLASTGPVPKTYVQAIGSWSRAVDFVVANPGLVLVLIFLTTC